jgi:hypothetical protein
MVVEAENEDAAWIIAGVQSGGVLYNGRVEQLPTRENLIAQLQAAAQLAEAVTPLITKAWSYYDGIKRCDYCDYEIGTGHSDPCEAGKLEAALRDYRAATGIEQDLTEL